MAEAAVGLAERTDALVDHGDACLVLATVLNAAGDQAGARAAAERGDLMRRVLPGSIPELDTAALHQIDALVEDLEGAGFDPLIDESELTVELTPCAHASSQASHRATLCSVHLSIMQSVLSSAGGPLSVDGMRSSCDPRECIVQLLHASQKA